MKNFWFSIVLMIALLACSDSFDLTTPPNASPNNNPANTDLTQLTQSLVFQGVADVATQNPETWDVPLPMAAVEAKLYLFGHQLSTLYYTELAEHGHGASIQNTSAESHNHSVSAYLQTAPGNFWGSLLWNGNCGTSYESTTNNTGCNGAPLFHVSNTQHAHTYTPIVNPAGISGIDSENNPLTTSLNQKTYLDHLQIIVDGEDVSNLFDLNPLGDGSKGHPINGDGASADLTANFAQSGHHRIVFKLNPSTSVNSLGGRMNYVLWLRIPLGPWNSSTPTPTP